jgi:hypothetical protein
MGIAVPRAARIDATAWRAQPPVLRIGIVTRDVVDNGLGTKATTYLGYVIKLVVYLAGALLTINATTNLGGLSEFGSWWAQPIVYQKLVVWSLLWEVLGLGRGSLSLAFRYLPPIGGVLYWLQPETLRLPPWPGRIPLTAGTRRGGVDVVLYAAVLASGVVLLISGATFGAPYDTLPNWPIVILVVALVLLGLRDKVAFLAARPERYGVMLLVFLFPAANMIFALKLCMLVVWWGAAVATVTEHFPFALAARLSTAPWRARRELPFPLWDGRADDLRPSRAVRMLARLATAVGFVLPVLLVLARGGWLSVTAVTVMITVHVAAAVTFPYGTALEDHAFAIFATLFLFLHYAHVREGTLSSVLLVVVLVVALAAAPVVTLLRPDLTASPLNHNLDGNGPVSLWLFHRDGAEERFDMSVVKPAPVVSRQLRRTDAAPHAELLQYAPLAARVLNLNGRALLSLLGRAVEDLDSYVLRDGELVAGVALGASYGGGRLHDGQLIDAIQFECDFEPGQLRVIALDAMPLGGAAQRYRIFDAADGLIDTGTVELSDMLAGGGETVPEPQPEQRPTPQPKQHSTSQPEQRPTSQPEQRPTPRPQPRPGPQPGPRRPLPARLA